MLSKFTPSFLIITIYNLFIIVNNNNNVKDKVVFAAADDNNNDNTKAHGGKQQRRIRSLISNNNNNNNHFPNFNEDLFLRGSSSSSLSNQQHSQQQRNSRNPSFLNNNNDHDAKTIITTTTTDNVDYNNTDITTVLLNNNNDNNTNSTGEEEPGLGLAFLLNDTLLIREEHRTSNRVTDNNDINSLIGIGSNAQPIGITNGPSSSTLFVSIMNNTETENGGTEDGEDAWGGIISVNVNSGTIQQVISGSAVSPSHDKNTSNDAIIRRVSSSFGLWYDNRFDVIFTSGIVISSSSGGPSPSVPSSAANDEEKNSNTTANNTTTSSDITNSTDMNAFNTSNNMTNNTQSSMPNTTTTTGTTTSMMYLYNVSTGNEIISCRHPTPSPETTPPLSYDDVIVIGNNAYYITNNTSSFSSIEDNHNNDSDPYLVILNINEALVNKSCLVSTLALPITNVVQQSQEQQFQFQQHDGSNNNNNNIGINSNSNSNNSSISGNNNNNDNDTKHNNGSIISRNSICSFGDGIIITTTYDGIYFLDLMYENTLTQFIDANDADQVVDCVIGSNDENKLLYLTHAGGKISVWELYGGNDGDDPITAFMIGMITSDYYTNPIMSTLQSSYMYTINTARKSENDDDDEGETTVSTSVATTRSGSSNESEVESSSFYPIIAIRNGFETNTKRKGDNDDDDDDKQKQQCKSGPFDGYRKWNDGIVLLKDGDELHSCCDCIDDWYFIPNSTLFMKQISNGELVLRNGTPGNSVLVWESSVEENENGDSSSSSFEINDINNDDNGISSSSNSKAYTRLQRDGNLVTRSGSAKTVTGDADDKTDVLWKTDVTDTIDKNYFLGLTNNMKYLQLWKGTPKAPDRIITTMRTRIDIECKSGPFTGYRNWNAGIVLLKDGDEIHSCCDCKNDWLFIDGTDIYMKQRPTGNLIVRLGSSSTGGDSIKLWESGINKNDDVDDDDNEDDEATSSSSVSAFTRLQRDGNLITRLGDSKANGEIVWKSDIPYRRNRNYFLGLTNDMNHIQLWKGTPKDPDQILIEWNTTLSSKGN